MAQGDVVPFEQFKVDVAEGIHNLETDVINIALTTGVTTPTAATPDPRWGAGGTTNFSTEQVATGGSYTGPVALANPSVTLVSGNADIDWDDPATWTQNGANPTNATWGIVYNDTATGKQCICYVDIGGAFDMTTGDLTITFGTPALRLS